MSKILIVADIHLNDYSQRNPSNKYRLYQGSRIVAQNIIKVGKQEGCDRIIFAGDIIEKSIIRPYVQAEVKYFLDTIMAEFKEGFIIFGNHDLDNKSIDQDISDAVLGVMLPNNLYYAHKKMIDIEGNTFGFCNWMPEFDLTWIPNKVDVLFTHATICYSNDSSEGRLFESQKLDETKFDLAICGDIHKRGQIGKYVSVGCTQRCKLSDPEEASGVVLDCQSKSWKWVDMNPDNNLIKFKTTTDMDEDGWHEDENTWYIHKQEITFTDETGRLKVDAWEEINALVENAINQSGLQHVHQEVLHNITNIDATEVDFNFTLLHLHCENWRSIESADLDFRDSDKILVQGSNGSGKSSLLSAIKYAFVDVGDTTGLSSLKPFVQFGKKDCMTEVEFLYQGNICKLQRGTKTYGLWINGEAQKYNDKRSFEKDARERFPFIKYIDAFFFDADKNSFLKSLSPEKITEITSQFLKFNRIDAYNETAQRLHDQVKLQGGEWITKLNETEKLLGYIQEKLKQITLPRLSKQELETGKQEGLEIQRKNNLWNKYITTTSRIQAQLETSQNKLLELQTKKNEFRDINTIDYEINAINNQIQVLQNQLADLANIRTTLQFKQREFDNLRNEGNNAWKEAQSLSIGKTCSHCGQAIQTTQAMENHKNELLRKVEELKPQIEELKNEISELLRQKENSDQEYQKINSDIASLNTEISKRMTEKNNQAIVENDIIKYSNNINELQKELNNLGIPEKVELPDRFMERMSEIETGINAWNLYETTESDKLGLEKEYNEYQDKVSEINNILNQLSAYLKLTGPVGVIFEEIFNKLCEQFSGTMVKYAVERKGKGAREHLSLVPYFNNAGNWVNIFMCSSGQRIMLDLDYLGKIIGPSSLGILILDEFLKPLDSDKLEVAIEMLKDMNIGCMMLTSHAESIPAFYNKTCIMSLDNDGKTNIILK